MKKKLLTFCMLLLAGGVFAGCQDTGGTEDENTCGNGTVDDGEKCDTSGSGKDACPADQDACDKKEKTLCVDHYEYQGKVDKCTAECVPKYIEVNGKTCDPKKDEKKCGNGTVDAGEMCDKGVKSFSKPGYCPKESTCEKESKKDLCQPYVHVGKKDDCSAACVPGPKITEAKDDDGCCPEGVTDPSEDNDCVIPADVAKECTSDKECQAGNGGEDAYCMFYKGVKGDVKADGGKGVCTVACSNASPCPDGSPTVCAPTLDLKSGYCAIGGQGAAGCTLGSNEKCVGDHMYCTLDKPTGIKYCRPFYTPDAKVGVTCTSNDDCGVNGECLTENATSKLNVGGMCVSTDCGDDVTCPENSKCSFYSPDGVSSIFTKTNIKFQCFKECQTDSDCRPGYGCDIFGVCQTLQKECTDKDQCSNGQDCLEIKSEGFKRCVDVGSVRTKGTPPNIGEKCTSNASCQGEEHAFCSAIAFSQKDLVRACGYSCVDTKQCADADLDATFKCLKSETLLGREYMECLKTCTDDSECKALDTNYNCNPLEGTTTELVCSYGKMVKAFNIGKSCGSNADCDGPEAICSKGNDTDAKGFCTAQCGQGFGNCPTDSICSGKEGSTDYYCSVSGCKSNANCMTLIPDTTSPLQCYLIQGTTDTVCGY